MTAEPAAPGEEPRWLVVARREVELGVRELAGAAVHPRIVEYYKATRLGGNPNDDTTPWCSAFACWVMEDAGYRSTQRANARSWLEYGEVMHVPQLGAIAVLWRGSPRSASGHVGFVTAIGNGKVTLLGGNQSNQVGYGQYGSGRVLGYRWPTAHDYIGPVRAK